MAVPWRDRMRVALLCLDPGVPLGGPKGCSVHLRSVAAALLRAGHEVDALVMDPGPERDRAALVESGLRVRPLDGAAVHASRAPGQTPMLPGAAEITCHLEAVAPDLVIERLALLACAGAEAASRLGVPHVYEINAPLENEAAEHRGFGARRGARGVPRRVCQQLGRGRRLGGSRALGARARSRGLRGPGGPERGRSGVLRAPRERRGGSSAPRPGVCPPRLQRGVRGLFKPWHDLENLVRAVAGLGVRTPSRLVLVGDGPRRSAVLAAALSSGVEVAHLPHVPHEDVPAVFALCDAVVVPYASEEAYFSPLKLAEAMSSGRSVVASATGPCMRLIRHGEDGLLVPPGDSAAMAAALRRLALDPDLRERLGAAARRSASRLFSWDRAVARMLALAGKHLSAARGG
ncbi:MAG: glycosyltransferase family 4 protein [Candidatus Eisenbacteria bacterium]|uniref:Glycosyltransferase family 4 protein n=1 Tax=Eiseniibacteriota bacterium TaxID=2212470 RepID=A0A538SE57_UNCEI|nr:MAG: glycosyltransferase family 4 protein [Candidatus Eisenbacteria bacterium]